MGTDLIVKNLHVAVEGNAILKGVDLTIRQGEVHAFMGPNGSGKSTLSNTLMGHPSYVVEKGSITFGGKDLLKMSTTERARAGLFLSFQYPAEVEGLTVSSFLRTAYNTAKGKELGVLDFHKLLLSKMEILKMDRAFARRYLNAGFSGGEKKRCEMLQMLVLEPRLAILDEVDSGLDVDALKVVLDGITLLKKQGMGILLITHYGKILEHLKPDHVHIFASGKILRDGGMELVTQLEAKGYDSFIGGKA